MLKYLFGHALQHYVTWNNNKIQHLMIEHGNTGCFETRVNNFVFETVHRNLTENKICKFNKSVFYRHSFKKNYSMKYVLKSGKTSEQC